MLLFENGCKFTCAHGIHKGCVIFSEEKWIVNLRACHVFAWPSLWGNKQNKDFMHLLPRKKKTSNYGSQPISGWFFIYNCCEQPNFVHLRVSVTQSPCDILSRHTFSQIIHLLELLGLQQCTKLLLIVFLFTTQKMFPAFGRAAVCLKLPFVDCIWELIVKFKTFCKCCCQRAKD